MADSWEEPLGRTQAHLPARDRAGVGALAVGFPPQVDPAAQPTVEPASTPHAEEHTHPTGVAREGKWRFAFPVTESKLDDRLRAGNKVLAVEVQGSHKAYALNGVREEAINDIVGGQEIVVIVRIEGPTGAAYSRTVGDRTLSFTLAPDIVVLGTIASAAGEALCFEPVRRTVRAHLWPGIADGLSIVPAALGEDAPYLAGICAALQPGGPGPG